jgi:hypothetical protein
MPIGLAFLNPLLLWALPLAAIPIVIHLLNRRRFDTRRWAAMEFLLRAMKRNRRRLQMEQWLILLLRTLAVLLLVLLVARPRFTGGVLGGGATHHVVVLDDSASMAHRGGADDAMDRAREAIDRLATRLATDRAGDYLTLARAGDVGEPLLALVPVAADLPRRVREALAGLRTGDGELGLTATLAGMADAAAAAREVAPQVELYLVTDLRRQDWTDADGAPLPTLATWLAGLDPDLGHLTVVDVGARDGENVAITAVRLVDRVCVAGIPVRIAVEVRNRGGTATAPVELSVEIGGNRFVRPVPALGPGEQATVEFEQTFRTPGSTGLRCALPADRYAPDDARSLAVEVRPAVRALLVDGAPGDTAEDAETFFLGVALDPGGDGSYGVEVRSLADHEFANLPVDELDDADIVWLCNVSRFTPELVGRLEDYLRSGGGVVIWLGEQIDVANYDELLWKDGAGLLPLPLIGVDGDIDEPRGIHLAAADHPLFEGATEQLRLLFAELVLVGRWIAMRDEVGAPVDRLLRVGDAEGPVLMAARTFENGGAVHVVGTTADASWTNLPAQFVFPILVDRLTRTVARPQDLSRNDQRPDGVFELRIDPAEHRPDVEVRRLGDEGDTRTFAAPPSGTEAVTVAIPMRDLDGTGLFEVLRRSHAGGAEVELIARNPLVDEGILDPAPAGTLAAGLPAEVRDRLSIRQGAEAVAARAVEGGSAWRLLGALMLLGLLVESVLAWRFGRR